MLRSGFLRRLGGISRLKVVQGVPVYKTDVICFHNNVYKGWNNRNYSEVKHGETKEVEKEDADADTDADSEYYVDVSNIEKRWKSLNFDTQQDMISYLKVKQEFGWEYLTKDEKRAIYYIAYGKWGARDPAVMSTAEFVFKLMTNMLLFSVLGFSLMNYAIDQEKAAQLEAEAGNVSSTAVQ